ncbi:toprim domain-containing protein [Spirosoma sp. BT702]|uniref:Toprim domain-containing protein n=1 Tax=Spirosoma profusum TaxID=2771354 RepID=A0A927AQD0_9BACT|nr:toprim domain-containing protein [Spirosoma profusum]MBD2700106.1 toprim domain-containing protein [Spirosoma profusum]
MNPVPPAPAADSPTSTLVDESLLELYDINKAVAKKYHEHLKQLLTDAQHPVTQYVRSRQLSDEDCTTWQLGYAPNEWKFITKPLVDNGAFVPAVNAGVCTQTDKSKYDFFRDRLMIPLRDQQRGIVGFTGRAMGADQEPKYLNTKETPIFKKGDQLFGIDKGFRSISRSRSAVLTEGHFDVITLHRFGVDTALGKGGTALSDSQVDQLKKLVDSVTLIYDIDPGGAGQLALQKDCEKLLQAGLRVLIFQLPVPEDGSKVDADSWARIFMAEEKPDRFDLAKHIRKEAEDGLIWLGTRWLATTDLQEQVIAESSLVDLLVVIDDDTWRKKYTKKLADLLDCEAKGLTQQVDKIRKQKQKEAEEDDAMSGSVWYSKVDGTIMVKSGKGGWNTVADNFHLFIKYQTEDENENLSWVLELRPTKEGDPIYLEVDHEDFCSASRLKKVITGKRYSLKISDGELSELQSYLFAKTQFAKATKIIRYGYHIPSGVFFFANVAINGQQLTPDEFGMVQTKKDDKPLVLSMPVQNKHKAHRFTLTDTQLSNNEFFKLYAEAHGYENALIPYAWNLMALFRDVALRYKNFSPILFLKGGAGTGKSSMIRVLTAAYGKKQEGVNLKSKNTEAALVKLMSQGSNCPIWFDEYHNEITCEGLFQAAYDNDGYHRSKDNTSSETDAIEIHSALALTSNYLPENPIFFSRCVFVPIISQDKSDAQRAAFYKLEELQEAGLGCLTVELLQYRSLVEQQYPAAFDLLHKHIKEEFAGEKLPERFYANMAQTLAVAFILASTKKIAITQAEGTMDILSELVEVGANNIRRQHRIMSEKTALSEFFEIIQSLYEQYQVHEEIHFDYRTVGNEIRIRLWFPQLYTLYAQQYRRIYMKAPADKDTLQSEIAAFEDMPDWESVKKQFRMRNDGESRSDAATIPRPGCCDMNYMKLSERFGLTLEHRKARN